MCLMLSQVASLVAIVSFLLALFTSAASVTPITAFTYDDLHGPLNWFNLNETANKACAQGTKQSPIVVDSSIPFAPSGSLILNLPPALDAEFENLGTNLEAVVNGSLTANGKVYALQQFHFHTPGEHRYFDEFYPMEVHFVFQNAADLSISVIGFVVQLGVASCSTFLSTVFADVESIAHPGNATHLSELHYDDLLCHFNKYSVYQYVGSLTTPPCSESVAWYLSSEPLVLDVDTYNRVKKIIKFNARYTQNMLGNTNLLMNEAQVLKAAKAV